MQQINSWIHLTRLDILGILSLADTYLHIIYSLVATKLSSLLFHWLILSALNSHWLNSLVVNHWCHWLASVKSSYSTQKAIFISSYS